MTSVEVKIDFGGFRQHGPEAGHVHLLINAEPPLPGEPMPVDDRHLHLTE